MQGNFPTEAPVNPYTELALIFSASCLPSSTCKMMYNTENILHWFTECCVNLQGEYTTFVYSLQGEYTDAKHWFTE